MSANIQNLAKITLFATVFGQSVDAIINREMQYVKPSGKKLADGNFTGVLYLNTNYLKFVEERVAVQMAIMGALSTAGHIDDKGRPMLFKPVIFPFHVAEDGTPATQLRVFAYRPKGEIKTYQDKEGKTVSFTTLEPSTFVCRLEEYGANFEFDADSKYATANTVAEQPSETVEG